MKRLVRPIRKPMPREYEREVRSKPRLNQPKTPRFS